MPSPKELLCLEKASDLTLSAKPIPSVPLFHFSQELQMKNMGLNNWCPADCNCQLNKPATQEHMFAYKILINLTDLVKNILVLGFCFHA